jgi:hypothetical protein
VPITSIKLSDPVNTLVTKTNTISRDLGDVATLVTNDSDVVTAINTLKSNLDTSIDSINSVLTLDNSTLQSNLDSDVTALYLAIDSVRDHIAAFDDSNEIITIAREALSLKFTGDYGTGTYDSDNGRITLSSPSTSDIRGAFSGGNGIDYDNTTGEFKLEDGGITSTQIANNAIRGRHFVSRKAVTIVNSAGTTLQTWYFPGA